MLARQGKTNEKPSVIQTRRQQGNVFENKKRYDAWCPKITHCFSFSLWYLPGQQAGDSCALLGLQPPHQRLNLPKGP